MGNRPIRQQVTSTHYRLVCALELRAANDWIYAKHFGYGPHADMSNGDWIQPRRNWRKTRCRVGQTQIIDLNPLTSRNKATLDRWAGKPSSIHAVKLLQSTYAHFLLAGWLLLLVAHLWLLSPVMQNGDAAVYNEQIAQGVINVRTTHIGYLLLGIVFNGILPFGIERNLNLMTLAFATVGAVSLFTIAKRTGAGTWLSLFAPLLAFSSQPFLRGAVLAEVDGVACGLILLAVAAWIHAHRVLAAVAFGLGMLVTPLTALSLPAIVCTSSDPSRTPQKLPIRIRNLGLFGAVSFLVYLPLVVTHWQDYWHGGRGILQAPSQSWDIAAQLGRSLHFFPTAAGPWLLLSIIGLLISLRSGMGLAYGTAVAIAATVLLGERFLDVPVQLPQLCLLAVFAVTLVARIPKQRFGALILCAAWLLTSVPSYRAVAAELETKRRQRAEFLEMAKQTPKLLVVGLRDAWDDGLPFERIVYGKTKLGLGFEWSQFARSSRSLASSRRGYAIWLLSPPDNDVMRPFTSNWRRETRVVLGHRYEVWIPTVEPGA